MVLLVLHALVLVAALVLLFTDETMTDSLVVGGLSVLVSAALTWITLDGSSTVCGP